MRRQILPTLLVGAAMLVSSELRAQQPAAPNLDAVPEKMPFSNAYGPPIGAKRANAVIEAAAAEASKRGWAMNIAVVDSGANLVAFLRMDDAQLASIAIAEHKARAARTKRLGASAGAAQKAIKRRRVSMAVPPWSRC